MIIATLLIGLQATSTWEFKGGTTQELVTVLSQEIKLPVVFAEQRDIAPFKISYRTPDEKDLNLRLAVEGATNYSWKEVMKRRAAAEDEEEKAVAIALAPRTFPSERRNSTFIATGRAPG